MVSLCTLNNQESIAGFRSAGVKSHLSYISALVNSEGDYAENVFLAYSTSEFHKQTRE